MELRKRGEVDDDEILCTSLQPRKKNKVDKSARKPYTCQVCRKSFRTPSVLKRHSFCHTGHKPYQCDFCGKGCTTPGNLIAHKRTHNKERPILCDICGQDFTDIAQLRKHTRTHPKITTPLNPPASAPLPTAHPTQLAVSTVPQIIQSHSAAQVTPITGPTLPAQVVYTAAPQVVHDPKANFNNLSNMNNISVLQTASSTDPPPNPERVNLWRGYYQQNNYLWGMAML